MVVSRRLCATECALQCRRSATPAASARFGAAVKQPQVIVRPVDQHRWIARRPPLTGIVQHAELRPRLAVVDASLADQINVIIVVAWIGTVVLSRFTYRNQRTVRRRLDRRDAKRVVSLLTGGEDIRLGQLRLGDSQPWQMQINNKASSNERLTAISFGPGP